MKKIQTTSKFKKSICRTTMTFGTGIYTINGNSFENYFSEYYNSLIFLPLNEFFKDKLDKINMKINVKGGGKSAQAKSIRNSLFNAFLLIFNDMDLKIFLKKNYRYLLVDDKRMKYPKLQLRKGARAKYQLSFR